MRCNPSLDTGMNLLLSLVVPDDLAYHFTVPGQRMPGSPWRMRSMSPFSSSYVFTGTLRTKSSYERVLPKRWFRPYSVPAAVCSRCCNTSCCSASGSVKWRSSLCCRGMNALRMMPVKLICISFVLYFCKLQNYLKQARGGGFLLILRVKRWKSKKVKE